MEKYRVKIKNGKIVGPLREGQLGELYIKGILSGIEACQQLPDGRWMEIQEFPKLNLLFENIAGGKISLEDLKDERLSKKTNDQDGTSNEETVQVSMSELPVIEEDPSPPLPKEFPIVRPEIQTEKTIIAKTDVLVKEIDLDKTVINKKLDAHKTSETIKSNIIDEEMRVIAPVSSVDDDENKEQEKHLAELEEKKKNTIDSHAKTQLFQLERIDKNDDKEAELSEATRLIKLEEALEKDRGEDQLENKVVEPLVPEILNPVQKLKKIL